MVKRKVGFQAFGEGHMLCSSKLFKPSCETPRSIRLLFPCDAQSRRRLERETYFLQVADLGHRQSPHMRASVRDGDQ